METPTSPPGTIFCLFCKGVVNVKDEKLEKFKKHMEDIHEIYFEHEFILAGSFLKKEEKENIVAVSKVRIKKSGNETKTGHHPIAELLLAEDPYDEDFNVTEANAEFVESFESKKTEVSKVVTLRAVHYGDSDDEEDLSKHAYKIDNVIPKTKLSVEKEIDVPKDSMEVKTPKNFKCEKCNKKFVNSRKLKNHKMNFRNKNCAKLKATCDSCKKSFKSRQSLNVHKFQGLCQSA